MSCRALGVRHGKMNGELSGSVWQCPGALRLVAIQHAAGGAPFVVQAGVPFGVSGVCDDLYHCSRRGRFQRSTTEEAVDAMNGGCRIWENDERGLGRSEVRGCDFLAGFVVDDFEGGAAA